jgi:chromosome segregation ATPase
MTFAHQMTKSAGDDDTKNRFIDNNRPYWTGIRWAEYEKDRRIATLEKQVKELSTSNEELTNDICLAVKEMKKLKIENKHLLAKVRKIKRNDGPFKKKILKSDNDLQSSSSQLGIAEAKNIVLQNQVSQWAKMVSKINDKRNEMEDIIKGVEDENASLKMLLTTKGERSG